MSNTLLNKHIETWSIYNAFVLITASIFALIRKDLNILLIIFPLSVIALISINRKQLFTSKPLFGIANTITLIRIIIILSSFIIVDFNNTNVLFYFLCAAVLLDFFDGRAARYFNESSFFGHYFDMEVDAFFVLIMCCFFYLHGDMSWWILIPGLLRYAFRLYTYCFPKPNVKEEKKAYATIIAASYFVVLLIGLITKGTPQLLILLSGSLAIVISFSIGIIQYHKQ